MAPAGDLITQGFQAELDGVLFGLGTDYEFVGPIEGFGIPDSRVTRANRPAQHGVFPSRMYLPGKTFRWTLAVLGSTVDDAVNKLIVVQSAFAPHTDGTTMDLVIRLGSLSYLVVGQPGRTEPDMNWLDRAEATPLVHCEFVATDPRMYNVELQTDETELGTESGGLGFPHGFPHGFGSATPGTLTGINYGTIETYPTFRITAGVGGLATPGLRAVSPFDATLRIITTLAEGEYLDIDMGAQTVTLNGTTSRTSLVNRPDEDDWFAIPGGPGGDLIGAQLDVQFIGTGAGTAVMSWRSANLL